MKDESIQIELIEGPLAPAGFWTAPAVGAVTSFEVVVRKTEQGRPIRALHFQAYEPMTTRELEKLARQTLKENGLLAIRVEHSFGEVPVGQVSFRLRVASTHGAEAFSAMDRFIERMKREVPLWKLPAWIEEPQPSTT